MKKFLLKYKNKIAMLMIAGVLVTVIVTGVLFNFHSEILKDATKLVFEVVILAAGFLVTCYLLFIELYKDRFGTMIAL